MLPAHRKRPQSTELPSPKRLKCLMRKISFSELNWRFKIGAHIGEGCSAHVYAVKKDRASLASERGKTVLKVFLSDMPLQHIKEEAVVHYMACFSEHPNIVRLLQSFYCAKTEASYFLLEYAEGGSLMQFIRTNNQFCIQRSCSIVRQVLAALHHCHSNGVMHFDVTPNNILLAHDGTVKLSDFGLSVASGLRADGLPVPLKQTISITALHYRAPECLIMCHFGSKLELSAACDMWSVGCVLAHLCGVMPQLRLVDVEVQHLYAILGLSSAEEITNWTEGRDIVRAIICLVDNIFVFQNRDAELALVEERIGRDGRVLLDNLLRLDPKVRPCASEALRSPWFHLLNTL